MKITKAGLATGILYFWGLVLGSLLLWAVLIGPLWDLGFPLGLLPLGGVSLIGLAAGILVWAVGEKSNG